jgi:ribosomal protein S18 acetylase RimI-like enzyme
MRYKIDYLLSCIDSEDVTGANLVALLQEMKTTPSSDVIGSLGLRLGGPGAFINSLFVRPDARGIGVASDLICKAIDISREQGKAVIGLSVRNDNTAAQALYRKLGFQPYDRCSDEYTEWVRVIIPPAPL